MIEIYEARPPILENEQAKEHGHFKSRIILNSVDDVCSLKVKPYVWLFLFVSQSSDNASGEYDYKGP